MAYCKLITNKTTGKSQYKVTWELKILKNKRKRCSKTFPVGTTKRFVEQFMREKEYEYEHKSAIDTNTRTLEDWGEEYFSIHAVVLSPTTIEGYLQMYRMKKLGVLAYLTPKILLSKVTPALLQQYINDLSETHSRKTVKNYKAFLCSLFSKAYQLQYIPSNPSSCLVIPKLNKKPKQEIEVYDVDEAKKLLQLAREKSLNVWVIESLGILAGLRKGEISALRYSNVFIDNGKRELHIVENRVQAMGNIYVKDPKTTAGYRVVEIPDMLAEVLRFARADYRRRKILYGEEFTDSDHVINQEHGENYAPDSIYNMHKNFLRSAPVKEAGIKYTRLHGLRHTFCSIQINNCEINPKVLQTQLGHRDITTTLNIYSHLTQNSLRQEANKLNDVMKNLRTGS